MLWGADCDDGDASRHPLAVDEPGGGDANCNGYDAPVDAEASAFGLAPAAGVAHYEPGAIDRVVLITIDTMHHSALDSRLMPRLSAFVARGAQFARSYAAGAKTRSALPLLHAPSLTHPNTATVLAAAGVQSRVTITTAIDPRRYGFDGKVTVLTPEHPARSVTDAALIHLDSMGPGPELLWVHYYDPHAPYVVHDEVGTPDGPTSLPGAYRSELAYLDRELGRLLDALSDDLDRAVVIVTGDHGESFGAHGIQGHGRGGFDDVLRVPSAIVAPGIEPGQYRQLVSHRDIPATIIGAFGFADRAAAAERFGRSWLRLRAAPAAPLHEFITARSARTSSGRVGITAIGILVQGRYKLVAGFEDSVIELFDLDSDPGETRDLVNDHPDVAAEMWRRLAIASDLDRYPAEGER